MDEHFDCDFSKDPETKKSVPLYFRNGRKQSTSHLDSSLLLSQSSLSCSDFLPISFPYPEFDHTETDPEVQGTWFFTLSRRMLRFGSTFNTPPLQSGEPDDGEGLEWELGKLLAQRLEEHYYGTDSNQTVLVHWEKVVRRSDFFGDLSFALRSEAPAVDVLLATLAHTPERNETVDFTCSYASQVLGALRGPAPLPEGVREIQEEMDLNQEGLKIIVGSGTTNEEYANQTYPKATLISVNGFQERLQNLMAGMGHVCLGDHAMVYSAAGTPECPECELLDFRMGPRTFLSMAVRRNGPLLNPNSTCSDGKQNGDETGVDCGGSCPPCREPSCYDGIKNGDETGVDCGGSCLECGSRPTHRCAVMEKDRGTYKSYYKECQSGCQTCDLELAGDKICSMLQATEQKGSCCDGYHCCHAVNKMCQDENTGVEYRCGSTCLESTANRLCEIVEREQFNPYVRVELYDPVSETTSPETSTEIRHGVVGQRSEADRFLNVFETWEESGETALYPCKYDQDSPVKLSLILPTSGAPGSSNPFPLLTLGLGALLGVLLSTRWSIHV